jgi:Domain of unknown function (DUF1906)
MRSHISLAAILATALAAPAQQGPSAAANRTPVLEAQPAQTADSYVGFDKNEYPGDAALPTLRRHFVFVGYWLNNPPGDSHNSWQGKRDALLAQGFGFLVLANGRLEAQIKRTAGTTPAALGIKDAAAAVAAAQREHFPPATIIFLDQEEGGRLTAAQSGYLFAWTEAVSHSGYRPGVYASGQPVGDAPGKTITTVQDIREHVAAQHLHEIAIWVYQDACPPANGCSLQPPPINASGTPDVTAWQYAQSPRRKDITAACSKTYAPNGNCYVPDLPGQILDLSVSSSADPSHGR